jgi:excisionase family DNA binding protein
MTDPLLSVAEVGERCGLSAKAIRGAIGRGELAAFKLAGRIRIAEADLAAWLDASRVEPDYRAELRPTDRRQPGPHPLGLRTLARPTKERGSS